MDGYAVFAWLGCVASWMSGFDLMQRSIDFACCTLAYVPL